MTGVLLIDKPLGPTSHDVVARVRRITRQRSIGHTGTLDPRASGLLPLVLGRATKLASLLTGGDKTYDATIRLGFRTDTDDEEGEPMAERAETLPDTDAIAAALDAFRGTFDQVPPDHSAKRVDGVRADALARRATPAVLKPVTVTVRHLDVLGRDADLLVVRVTATAGFYVRALARDLGTRLGCGGHLAALRRIRSGHFAIEDAITLDVAETLGDDLSSRLVSPADALPHLRSVSVTETGLKRAVHGNDIRPEHVEEQWVASEDQRQPVKVLAADGHLVALAEVRAGALHPVVVLG